MDDQGKVPTRSILNPNCPACGYPGHGEKDPRRKYMGIYTPGEACGKCRWTDTSAHWQLDLRGEWRGVLLVPIPDHGA